MTTLQVHLLMLALGLVAFWLLAGVLSNRKSFSKRLRRRWWLGAIAGILVAISPFSRFWRTHAEGVELLTQSLLISAICLLALLLIALLRAPFAALINSASESKLMINGQHADNSATPAEAGLAPIVIDADAPAAMENNSLKIANSASVARNDGAVDHSSTPEHSVEDSRTDLDLNALNNTDTNNHDQAESQAATIDKSRHATADTDTVKLASDQEKITQRHVKDIESVVPLNDKHDATQTLDKSISRTSAANDNNSKEALSLADDQFDANPVSDTLSVEEELEITSVPTDAERLDLSETEQLFAEIRSQNNDVQLPDDEELRKANESATIDELDFDAGLVVEDKASKTQKTDQTVALEAEIEEAEVLDVDDADLEFGNDLTGEYSHPTMQSSGAAGFVNSDHIDTPTVPDTLDEALIAARVTAVSLQSQVNSLEDNIVELDKLRDSAINAAEENTAGQQLILQEKEALLESEDKARRAAESVIAAQSALIDRAKRQQAVVNTLLSKERARLNELQQEITRSRKMARTAANLARRAAIAQQEIRDVAIREQNARLKSQESTRKAVTIARNAISALAAEERKRGITRH